MMERSQKSVTGGGENNMIDVSFKQENKDKNSKSPDVKINHLAVSCQNCLQTVLTRNSKMIDSFVMSWVCFKHMQGAISRTSTHLHSLIRVFAVLHTTYRVGGMYRHKMTDLARLSAPD